ncbi:MAG: rhomboid family intramembrane serine protease [Cyanobacteria bacterium J007]|nr:MAG: rhomboid family intramembrane serine protease [Cyanobacteria bacterium J007]
MIPIDDNLPQRSPPIATTILIALNIAIFIIELHLDARGELTDFLNTWALVPARLTSMANDAIASQNPAAWVALLAMGGGSLLSAMFLHGSFSQILGNLLFLWVFGRKVEDILGHFTYFGFYLLCGILSGIGQAIAEPSLSAFLIGANGAIAAILGAYLLNFPKAKIDSLLPLIIIFIPVEVPAFFYSLWWFVQQIFYGIGELGGLYANINPSSTGYWLHGLGMAIGAGSIPFFVRFKPKTAIY